MIDIDKAFNSKNPQLYKLLPGFVLRWVKRIVHQEEINQFVIDNEKSNGIQFGANAVIALGAKAVSIGLENIPKTGGVIIASNHPLGGADGLAFLGEVGKVRSDLKFIVNDLLMQFKSLENVFIPVNKHGSNTKQNLQRIEQLYGEGHCILIFPAGLCSRKQDGKIMDLPWQKSFISQSVKHQLPIVPVYIDAFNSNFFYNLANIRKRLGIKANIEMFFLANEMFKQKGKTITFTFGKPIESAKFDKSKNAYNWAQILKNFIYELKDNKQAIFSN
ncbi:MAG: 1-acyl-sn-glycerol-3-phosphate acyltransferase [Bacteroidota bacterium]|jgi:1-acyl-sn-glycerol-3-phosphate acyltransferase